MNKIYFLLTYLSKSCSLWSYLNVIKCNFNCLVIWHSCGDLITCADILGDEKKQECLFWTLGWQHSHLCWSHLPYVAFSFLATVLLKNDFKAGDITPNFWIWEVLVFAYQAVCFFPKHLDALFWIRVFSWGSWNVYPPRHISKCPKTSLFVPEKGWHERREGLGLLWKAKWNSESHILNKTKAL